MSSTVKLTVNQHEGCEACKLKVACSTWRPGPEFNYSPKYLFVLEQPFPGLLPRFKKLMRQCEFDMSEAEVAYLTRCYVGEEVKGQIREATNCKPLFDKLLEKVDESTLIIPMGATATKVLTKRTSIQAAHGSVNDIEGRIYIPTIHPLQVLNYPDSLETFLLDLQRVREAADGELAEKAKVNYTYITTVEEADAMFDTLEAAEAFSFDIEATSLSPFRDDPAPPEVLMVSFSCKEHTAFVLPIDHRESPWAKGSDDYNHIVERLKALMANPDLIKIAHNGKYDTKYLKVVLGVNTKWHFDTLLAHYTAVTEEEGTHSLKVLAWEYTDMGGYDDALEEYKADHPEANLDKGGHYGNIPWKIIRKYSAADADCTFRLYNKLSPLVEAEFHDLYYNVIMPGTQALAKVELAGAPVDMEYWRQCSEDYPRLMSEILKKIREFPEIIKLERKLKVLDQKKKIKTRVKELKKRLEKAHELEDTFKREAAISRIEAAFRKLKEEPVVVPDRAFNPGSPDQKTLLFFDIMGFEPRKLTKSNNKSTDKEVLKELYQETRHPLLKEIGKYIKLHTLYAMFVEPLPEIIGRDGRLRGLYNVAGTKTGRLSMSEPNLQQIPKNIKEDDFLDISIPSIKKLFKVPKKHVLFQFDYSQVELRVLASLSGDATLSQAYINGEDVHRAVAAEVNGITLDEVTDVQRGAAKAVNFGLLYGQGAAKLARGIGVSLTDAKDYIKTYFARLPGVRRYISHVKAHVREHGRVTSPFGRVRRLSGVFSGNDSLISKAERQAVNSPIQSAASDCTLISLVRITRAFIAKKLRARIIITVHDSILIESHYEDAPRVYKIVKKIMQNPPVDWLTVPMVADAEIGFSWGALTKVASVEDVEKFIQENF